MLPRPTNVPNRVMNAMLARIINHRSEDFRILYRSIIEKTQRLFQTQGDIVLLSSSVTGAVEASVVNLIKKDDKVVIPVNGEFSTRLADLIDSGEENLLESNRHMVRTLHSKNSKKSLTNIRISKHCMQFTMKLQQERQLGIWTS